MRTLIIAHGHPDFAKGGGELAAHNLFTALRQRGEDTWFLAAHREQNLHHGGSSLSMLRDREILFFAHMTNYFFMTPSDRQVIWRDFRGLLERLQPDIIHFHHFINLGIQCIRQAILYRQVAVKSVKIILTLHEYLAVCANDGQMIMRQTNELCTESSPMRCSYCFRDLGKSPEDFFLRERLFQACLTGVDMFIAPSHFLKRVYVQWGIVDERITVIENGQIPAQKLPPRFIQEPAERTEFAYLGQITRFKGLDVLLSAFDFLPKAKQKTFRIHVFGVGLEYQTEDFRKKIEMLRERLGRLVSFHGVYHTRQLPGILATIDTVVVPSIWWENSPLVIQESFKYGRPVICSDIGGMREKVRHAVDGLHFSCRSSLSLVEAMVKASEPSFWNDLYRNIPVPFTIETCMEQHKNLYYQLRKSD